METNVAEVRHARSQALFTAAQRVIPGGVNSPVRAFHAVGGAPVALAHGQGSCVWDVDGNPYLDYVGSWGPLILGHAPVEVVEAITKAAALGMSFGALTEREVELAQLLCRTIPGMEQARLVNSGTEAVMSAVRLARAFTGRDLIIKFEGGYHGHGDSLLAKAGSGIATQGIPGTPGVPAALAALTITIPFNDLDALRAVLAARGGEVACLIGEPVPANMGVVLPHDGYWAAVRRMLTEAGALLILDEVITGFRLGWTGSHAWTGITADLYTLGKIIGGGLPVGAFGGRTDIMQLLAPAGPVYQAGTLSGNPLAVAAGLTTLRLLEKRNPYAALDHLAATLADGLNAAARRAGVPVTVNRAGSMLTVFFTEGPVMDYTSAARSDTRRYARFFHACLAKGVMFAPSQFEAAFLSTAHTQLDIEETLARAAAALREAAV